MFGSMMSSAKARNETEQQSVDTDMKLTVALLGNPNTGKSTLFSAIAGIPTRIGNYPGVTVEEKSWYVFTSQSYH